MTKKKVKKTKDSVARRFKITRKGKVLRWDKKKAKPVEITGALARKIKKLLGKL